MDEKPSWPVRLIVAILARVTAAPVVRRGTQFLAGQSWRVSALFGVSLLGTLVVVAGPLLIRRVVDDAS